MTLGLVVCFAISTCTAAQDRKPAMMDVRGPTLVAFFPPVSDAELRENPDTNEALSDFQLYASQAQKRFEKTRVRFHVVYARSFNLRTQGRIMKFKSGKVDVGYYLIAPRKKPQVEYGVMTDDDLIEVARRYFGETAFRP